MKMSRLFLPTIRELPSDAEARSHILMLRAAMIRQISSGVYSYLPLGYRVLRKIEAVVREEMDRAGAQELHMPALLESELYRRSGRWDLYGDDMFRLKDRGGRDFLLGPTHEELFADLVRWWLRSYKQLPVTLYQIQNKYRDEVRPRYGLIRCKEFVMKDAYSFDESEESLDESYGRMYAAYCRVFERLGLRYLCVEADNGAMGGSGSQEFMVPNPIGEDDVVHCACRYAANMEKAAYRPAPQAPQGQPRPLERVYTPDMHTIAQITEFLDCSPLAVAKTLIVVADGAPLAVMLRGDRDLNEAALRRHLGCAALELADAATVESVTGAVVGFAGPAGLTVPVIADSELEGMTNLVVGANETDWHLKNACPGRDFAVREYAPLRRAAAGDACPRCGEPLRIDRGIEIGHIFKLGRRYTETLGCRYTDPQGQERTPLMGCYGIGVSRLAAAVIEQSCDEQGIVWPLACAPYQVILVALGRPGGPEQRTAEELYEALSAAGVEVLLDDRNERAGVKFTDADLIGIPLRVTVGRRAAEGVVEYKFRNSSEVHELPAAEVLAFVRRFIRGDEAF